MFWFQVLGIIGAILIAIIMTIGVIDYIHSAFINIDKLFKKYNELNIRLDKLEKWQERVKE